MTSLLNIEALNKHFDGVTALDDFSCTTQQGQILGLIGPNGAGKTTLFNVMTGFITPDSGRIKYNGQDITRMAPYRITRLGMARTFQNLRLIRQLSVLENVLLCFPDQAGERLGIVFFQWKRCKGQERQNTEKALALLVQADLGEKVNDPAEDLSYGQQKLLSMAKIYQAKRKYAEALEWAQKGLSMEERGKWSNETAWGLKGMKQDLLHKVGRTQDALQAAWDEFRKHASGYSYDDLMKYVPRSDRKAWHTKAMDVAQKGSLRGFIELRTKTKELEILAHVWLRSTTRH